MRKGFEGLFGIARDRLMIESLADSGRSFQLSNLMLL